MIFGLLALAASANAFAKSELTIEVAFREPASSFEIIDNVSNWWPGYNEAEYRAYWEDTFGISATDTALFNQYKVLREKYFDTSGQSGGDAKTRPSGLFTDTSTLTADPIGQAFYQSETFDEAFTRLNRFLLAEEVAMLKSFFAHFEDRLSRLSAEAAGSIEASLERTQKALDNPEVAAYLNDLAKFVGIEKSVHFTALYVWWPDAENVRANPNGPFLLIRLRPYADEKVNSADVVVHEAVHALLAAKSNAIKKSLSETILESCPNVADQTSRLSVIEEPMASILGNMEFRRRFDPNRFAWGREWYGNQWVDLVARLFYPSVMEAMANDRTLEHVVTKDAAALLTVAMKALSPSSP